MAADKAAMVEIAVVDDATHGRQLMHRRSAATLVALALALGGCTRAGEPGRRGTVPNPRETAAMTNTLSGSWTKPLDGYVVVHLAGAGEGAILGGRVGDVPELRAVDAALRMTPLPAIPPPSHEGAWTNLGPVDPHVAVDPADPSRVVTNRGESQGGSWGLAFSPRLLEGRWEEIESPTEADIGFGVPLILRGDEIFSLEGPGGVGGRLWRFERGPTGWRGRTLALPQGERVDLGWGLALSDDGSRLVVVAAREDGPRELQVFERDQSGALGHARSLSIPAEPHGVGFLGPHLALGFIRPTEHGHGVWVMDVTSGAVLRRLPVPADESNGTLVQDLRVAEDRLLVSQLDRVLVFDPSDGRLQCVLGTPARDDGRHTYPVAARAGERVFVSAQCARGPGGEERSRVGVFELSACGQ